MKVVCDAETDGLNPTKVYCIVAKDISKGGKVYTFIEDQCYKEFPKFARNVEHWIGHNYLSFDAKVFKDLLGVDIKIKDITDTLLLSRLFNPVREGGHSLKNWGKILGCKKQEHDDWTKFSPEMLSRCKRDVLVNIKLYKHLLIEGRKFSKKSIQIEHHFRHIINIMEANGFKLDVEKAHGLFVECKTKADEIEENIRTYFPPKARMVKEVEARRRSTGGFYSRGLTCIDDWANVVGGNFSKIEWITFNLASPKQKVDRLSPYWKPKIKTKSGKSWKICEENLNTISDKAPEQIRKLAEWQMLTSRWKMVEAWLEKVDKDDRIHGGVITIGAITHRGAHRDPNMANIPAIRMDGSGPTATPIKGMEGGYGYDCRSCWIVGSGNYLLGTDASGIQLRILAHHINNKEFTKEVIEGQIHIKNMEKLGGICDTKAKAKTFIYAWIMGAGIERVRMILECSYAKAKKEGIKFKQVAWVHDEWQTEVETKEEAERLGEIQVQSIINAGEYFRYKVPLDGEYKIDKTWALTH